MMHPYPPDGGRISQCEDDVDLRFYVQTEDAGKEEPPHMIIKAVLYFGQPCALVCDARCEKAWGINSRPQVRFDDEDDTAYLADDELGIAPEDPGTYEGGRAKPVRPEERLNKWCARECERSVKFSGETPEDIVLPDFSRRRYNQPWRHPEAKAQ